MLGIHIHCVNYIYFKVFQRQRKENQLTFESLIQLTASLHQANRSYPKYMMYSHQSSILWRTKAALSQCQECEKRAEGAAKGSLGGVRKPIIGGIACGCWTRTTMVQFRGNNCTKMHMEQSKCSSSYHSSCLIVIMWGGILMKTGKLFMGFLVWRCWRKIREKKIVSISRNSGRISRSSWKTAAKFFIWGWGKNHCTKNELNLLSKNSIGKYDIIIT